MWDRRYRDGAYAQRSHPNPFLVAWLANLTGSRALDVACGSGRNSLYLAENGYSVTAVDISAEALTIGRQRVENAAISPTVEWLEQDLDDPCLPPGPYDVIIMFRYVNTALIPDLIARLAPGGHLLVEEHLVTSADVTGPRGNRFRVAPDELANAAGSATSIIYYWEGIVRDPGRDSAAVARMICTAT